MKLTATQLRILKKVIAGEKYQSIASDVKMKGRFRVHNEMSIARKNNDARSTPQLIAMAFREGLLK